MMGQYLYFISLILVLTIQLVESRSDSYSSVSFNKSELFHSTDNAVFHMELDLYRDDGSIMFSSWESLQATDGKTTATLATTLYSAFTGFTQINETNVAVAAYSHHCIKMLNRVDGSMLTLAGTCDTPGYVEGGVGTGRLNYPHSIVIDAQNPNKLLVTDQYNHALRSVDLHTGELSTVINSDFNYPTYIAWADNKLLVSNQHYISQVSWDKNESVENIKVTGSTFGGYVDGSFNTSRFNYPSEITRVGNNTYLVADANNNVFRLLDFNSNEVGPVCFDGETSCTNSSQLPAWSRSVLKVGEVVYVGAADGIYKVTGVCWSHHVTVYLDPGQNTTPYTLPGCSYAAYLSERSHKFLKQCSIYNINVLKSPIVRRLMFVSRYDVSCRLVRNSFNRILLTPAWRRPSRKLQHVCANDCNMSSEIQPWYMCKNNELTVYWPTDKTFSVVTKEVPDKLRDELRERLVGHETEYSEVEFQTFRQPTVEAKQNSRGERIHFLLFSTCADKTLRYDSVNDLCN